MSLNFHPDKALKLLPIRFDIAEAEGKFPDYLATFFKCAIVLFRRDSYDKGFHSNDIQECEIQYANYSDEKLLKNYNELYKIITLKWGHLL